MESDDSYGLIHELDMLISMARSLAKVSNREPFRAWISRKLADGIKECREAMGVPVGCLIGRAIYDW